MIAGIAAAVLLAATPARAATPCLQLADSSSTHYHPVDDHTIIVESVRRWYRLTVSPSSLMLQPQSFFVNEIHGPPSLCTPLDFQLYVADGPGGFREPLIVQDFVAIPLEEARALRPKFVR